MKKYATQLMLIVIVAVLTSVAMLTYGNLNNLLVERDLVRHYNRTLREVETVLSIVKDAEIGHRGFQLTRDSSFLEPYLASLTTVEIAVHTLDSLMVTSAQQVRLDTIKGLVNNQYRLVAEMLVTTSQKGAYIDATYETLLLRGERNMNTLRNQIKIFSDVQRELLMTRLSREKEYYDLAPIVILVYGLLAIGSVVILFYRVSDALRKRTLAERELVEKNTSLEIAQNLLRNVLNSSPNSILAYKAIRDNKNEIIDFEGMSVNEAGLNFANMKEKDIVGKSLLATFPHAALELVDVYKEVVKSGESKNIPAFEYTGFNQWFNITIVKSGDGFVVTSVNITDLKIKEKRLEQINSDLKRSNEELEQFAYVASHDLQEPLRKIRAFGDLLATEFITKEADALDYIQRMQNASSRMQVLIQDILSFSRVSQNSSKQEPLDLNSLVNEVVDDLENQIVRENAEVIIENLPTINGDRAQIKRLFQNLISNAIKFHQPGRPPRVTVTATKLSSAKMHLSFQNANPKTSYCRFEVADNGIGFDAQYTEKIFNIFQRLHGRADYEGTGIGLAICKKIVTNHWGYITAESSKDGSTFIVILPVT
jgi:signal transduction histidine kinase